MSGSSVLSLTRGALWGVGVSFDTFDEDEDDDLVVADDDEAGVLADFGVQQAASYFLFLAFRRRSCFMSFSSLLIQSLAMASKYW